MKKIIFYIGILISLVLMSSLIFLAIKNINKSNNVNKSELYKDEAKEFSDNDISKNEWIKLLCEYVGANENNSKKAYFEDVNEDDEFYSYIQAAVEWKFIDKQLKFDGNQKASGKFIALSAIKSIGDAKLSIYYEKENFTEDDYLEIAIENELIESAKMEIGISYEEAQNVIEKLDELSFSLFWPTNKGKIEYNDCVIEIEDEKIEKYDKSNEQIYFYEQSATIEANDIISFNYNGFKIIRKIKGINNNCYLLEIPDIEDAIKNLTVSDVKEMSIDDIKKYYGEENLEVVKSEGIGDFTNISKIYSGEKEYNGFKIDALVNDDGVLEIYVLDKDTGKKYKLPIEEKLPEDYSNFSASLDIDSLIVGAQVKYSGKNGVEYADVAVNIDSKFCSELAGTVEHSILLFETPTPLGCGLVGANIQIYLITTLDGKISIEAELPYQSDVHYEKEKGFRNINHELEVEEPTLYANAEMDVKTRVAPMLIICEILPILDVEIDESVCASAEIIDRETSQICADVSIAYPIIDVSVGCEEIKYEIFGVECSSLFSTLDLSKSWSVVSEDDAFIIMNVHFESFPNGESQFVDECTYIERKERDEKEEVEEIDAVRNRYTYKTRYEDVNKVTCPTFTFEYYDNWFVSGEEIDYMEHDTIQNQNGVTIEYYGMAGSFGSTTADARAGYFTATVTKVAESSFVAGAPRGTDTDFSWLGKFCVAEIKVYKREDGYSEEAEIFDGPTYYAVIPESYLGEMSYSTSGFLPSIAFEYNACTAFYASAPMGKFSDSDKEEVIQILSSFKPL